MMTETHQSIFFQRVDVTLKNADGPKRINSIAIMAKISEVNVCYALKQLIDKGRVVKFGNGWFQHRDQFKTVGPHILKKKRAKRKKRANGEGKPVRSPDPVKEEYLRIKEIESANRAQEFINEQILDDIIKEASNPPKWDGKQPENIILEEKVMPESTLTENQMDVLEKANAAMKKINKKEIFIPPLPESELKLALLDSFIGGIDDKSVSDHLFELKSWIARIEEIILENTDL